jgi:hypothetical protein
MKSALGSTKLRFAVWNHPTQSGMNGKSEHLPLRELREFPSGSQVPFFFAGMKMLCCCECGRAFGCACKSTGVSKIVLVLYPIGFCIAARRVTVAKALAVVTRRGGL